MFLCLKAFYFFSVFVYAVTNNKSMDKTLEGKKKKEVKARSPAPVSLAQVFEQSICYLTDIDEIWFFQVHVEFDQHPQHVVTELLVLHQGHAHLQAVGKEATHIILEGK